MIHRTLEGSCHDKGKRGPFGPAGVYGVGGSVGEGWGLVKSLISLVSLMSVRVLVHRLHLASRRATPPTSDARWNTNTPQHELDRVSNASIHLRTALAHAPRVLMFASRSLYYPDDGGRKDQSPDSTAVFRVW